MSALAFRQPTDLRVDLGTEKRDPVFPGQAATTLGVLGSRLADSLPRGLVQRGMGCIASAGGTAGDRKKNDGASPGWDRTHGGWRKNTAEAAFAATQLAGI